MIPPVKPVGVEGYKRSAGHVWEEFNPKLRGQRGLRVYREMADNSAVIGSLLWLIECLITQADQNIEVAPQNEGIGEAVFIRDHVDGCFDDMASTRTAFFSDILSMLWAGFSYFETTYKLRGGPHGDEWRRSKYDDHLVGWADNQIRVQESIDRWEWCDNQLVGAWQRPWPSLGERYLPLDGWSKGKHEEIPVQCLHFKTRHNRGNPEGKPLIRNAYRSYWHAARLEDLEGIGAWRDMAGVLTQEVPPEWLTSAADANQQQAVENFRTFVERANRGEYEGLVVPAALSTNGNPTSFKTYLMQGGGRQPMNLDTIIRRHESRMAVSMLGELVLLGTGGSGASGSWALSSAKTSMLARGVRALMAGIEDNLNRFAIPRLVHFNGWDMRLAPVFTFGDIESDESIELLTAIATAAAGGILAPGPQLERYLRQRYGLPLEDDGEPGALRPRSIVTQAPLVGAADEAEDHTDVVEAVDDDELSAEDEAEAEEALERGMSPEEAAVMAGVSPNQIRNAIRRGQLPGAKIGNTYRVMNTDLREYMRGGGR